MPDSCYESEFDDDDDFDPVDDSFDCDGEASFRVSSPDDEDLVDSPDAACEMICDMVTDQFWEWYGNPARSRRFKPIVKLYEVAPTC